MILTSIGQDKDKVFRQLLSQLPHHVHLPPNLLATISSTNLWIFRSADPPSATASRPRLPRRACQLRRVPLHLLRLSPCENLFNRPLHLPCFDEPIAVLLQ